MYIELHCSSAFSFLDGASLPEALVARAAALEYPALALLDRDGLYGAPRFHLAAKKAGLRAIIGAELTIRGQRPDARGQRPEAGGQGRSGSPDLWPLTSDLYLWRLPVLVENRQGYRNLSRLVTEMKLRAPKGEGALELDELEGRTGGLVALVGREALHGPRHGVGGLIDRAVGLFGRDRVYIELQRHLRRDEESDNAALIALASAFHVPVVATNGVRFAEPSDRPLYDVLTCIRHQTTIERAGRRLSVNAERCLKTPVQMARLFADLPHAVETARDLSDRLEYTMADLGYRFPDYPVPAGETMASFLRKITEAGARERYRPFHDRARAQIERELALVERLQLAGYFLIVWDIVNYCRQHGILVQGRGSAANSAVCYSLGITAVDPVGMDLLFERFLSEERGEWPDIDLDLPSGDRREQVIQYVYERYGKLGAAMTANVITYRGRSAAREVGKVLGFEPDMVDRLAKLMNPFEWIDPQDTFERHLRDAGLDPADPSLRTFGAVWTRIQDLPRHLGQHSGGMIVCQGRLDEVVPLENASMPGRVVAQWDKDDCADMGIVKVDLLGLGMMSVLQDALTLVNEGVREKRSEQRERAPLSSDLPLNSDLHALTSEIDLAHLPPDDPAVYRMLQEADTIGVFQVESRAQMATLPRMHPERFYDIVVEVAIIRPGPIVGQMVHPYLKRRRGVEPVTYPHQSLAPILERTLGVPLFQEQLLRMAMVAAGFSGGEAEELRRAFGFKRSERRMQDIEKKLRAGIARQGIEGEAAEEIVRAITSFALYGFPESHAASFALLVYASAYLKAHYPAAFYTAMLNNQPMGFYSPATLVKDAQRRGVRFVPIDVQVSHWDCTIEADGRVRLGLRYVSGLRAEAGKRIESGSASRAVLAGPAQPVEAAQLKPASGPACRRCPKCGCEDDSMIERVGTTCFCNICAHEWGETPGTPNHQIAKSPNHQSERFTSVEALVASAGLHRDEVRALADIGALNSFGYDRRTAAWQVERAMRSVGELLSGPRSQVQGPRSDLGPRTQDPGPEDLGPRTQDPGPEDLGPRTQDPGPEDLGPRTSDLGPDDVGSPLSPMSLTERIAADYEGTGLTIGPHPMSLRRPELALRGVLRASDLPRGRHGRRVRIAGAVITRQRPGTAKGFVFLTLEDETGIANVIVRPDLFAEHRRLVVGESYLLVEGTLQIQEGVTSVKAERFYGLSSTGPSLESRDFH